MLEGGCSVPVGCESKLVELPLPKEGGKTEPTLLMSGAPRPPNRAEDPHAATITLNGTITSLSGTSAVFSTITRKCYSLEEVEQLGAEVAQELIASGGKEILEELGRHVKEVHGEDGVEIPGGVTFEVGGRAAVNTAPAGAKARRGSMGQSLSKSPPTSPKSREGLLLGLAPPPPHPHRTVFKEGEVCLRPQGW